MVASILLWLVTFFTTRERVEPPPDQQVDFRNDLGVVLKNRAWIILVVVAVFTLTNVGVRMGATFFYVKYYIEDTDRMVFWIFDRTSVAWLSGSLAMVLGTLLTKPLTERFDKRTLMIWLTALNGIFILSIFLLRPDQYWAMVWIGFVGTIIVGPTPAIVWSMYADVADYGELEFGRRTTGLIFSGLLFSQKMGLAFGAGLAGWILGWFGYIDNQPQSESALLGIRLIFTVFPGVLTLLAAVTMFFYNLPDQRVREINEVLAARRLGRTLS